MTIQHLDKTDKFMMRLRKSGGYERHEFALVRKLLKPGQVFVDVGAHIGYYTTLAAELVGPTGRVYAFEPNPLNAKLLRKNTAKFGDVVRIVRAAASDHVGSGRLYLNHGNSGDHRLYECPGRKSIEVDVVTLDSVLDGVNVDFIKIDAQGVEPEILRGAEQTLMRSENMSGIVEYLPKRLVRRGVKRGQLLRQLHQMGFEIYTFRDQKLELITEDVGREVLYKNLFIKKRGAT